MDHSRAEEEARTGLGERGADPGNPIKAPVHLVTVHGTGSGQPDDVGNDWWQLESDFLKAIADRLDLSAGQVRITPFHWKEGPNTESGRRDAGAELCKLLKGYDEAGEDYHLVGHSHGGSVIYASLLESVAKKTPLEHLKSWATIGTPFLDYVPNGLLLGRLGSKGLTFYASAFGAMFLGGALFLKYFLEFQRLPPLLAFVPLVVFGIVMLVLLYAMDRLTCGARAKADKQACAKQYEGRWIGLFHREDEAICALRSVESVKGPIIPPTFLEPCVAGLPILVAIAGTLWAASRIPVEDFDQLRWEGKAGDFAEATLILVCIMAVGVALFVLFMGGVVATLRWFFRLIGRPLAKSIDGLVWSSVRQAAWGDDQRRERVASIGSHPPNFSEARFHHLPAAVGEAVSRHGEGQAVLTLQRMRKILGMTSDGTGAHDLCKALSEQLKWKELIHTSYFHVPQFIDLLAYGLHRAGLADLRKEGWTPGVPDQVEAWYREIQATEPGGFRADGQSLLN